PTRRSPDRAGRAGERARAGEGPSLIEIRTIRLWGHFEGDAQGYRPDLDTVPEHDPLPRYEERLREAGILDDVSVKQIYADATDTVEAAIEFAKSSPVPDPADVGKYVFAEEESA